MVYDGAVAAQYCYERRDSGEYEAMQETYRHTEQHKQAKRRQAG
jgi:hypothetical protein